eukprot:1963916-Rhodomonas_salina.1
MNPHTPPIANPKTSTLIPTPIGSGVRGQESGVRISAAGRLRLDRTALDMLNVPPRLFFLDDGWRRRGARVEGQGSGVRGQGSGGEGSVLRAQGLVWRELPAYARATHCSVLTWCMVLREVGTCYGMSGTDLAYGATQSAVEAPARALHALPSRSSSLIHAIWDWSEKPPAGNDSGMPTRVFSIAESRVFSAWFVPGNDNFVVVGEAKHNRWYCGPRRYDPMYRYAISAIILCITVRSPLSSYAPLCDFRYRSTRALVYRPTRSRVLLCAAYARALRGTAAAAMADTEGGTPQVRVGLWNSKPRLEEPVTTYRWPPESIPFTVHFGTFMGRRLWHVYGVSAVLIDLISRDQTSALLSAARCA